MGLLDFLKKKKLSSTGKKSGDIADSQEIGVLLDTLAENKTSCNMLIGQELFSSMIIDNSESHFYTDLMIPLASNTLLSTGQGLRIGFIHEDAPYQMYCTYSGRKETDNYESLAFSRPGRIIYVDRRENKRVRPRDEKGVRVLFDLGISSSSNVDLVNISEKGIAIRTPLTGKLRIGEVLDRIDIILPNSQWISCKGVVRRIKSEVIGVELKDLTVKNRNELMEFIQSKKQ